MCCEHLQHSAMLSETFFLQCASTLAALLLKVEEAFGLQMRLFR